MKRRDSKSIAASVRQRLLNEARATDRPFNEILQYFAMERFLYRLSVSPWGEKFILKGALMLATWQVSRTRPTKDIDLLGEIANDIDVIVAAVEDACRQQVEPDGLDFIPESVQAERIAEDAEYEGVRARFHGKLGTARVTMQLDVGFGDVVVPGPVTVDFPTILDHPAPRLRGYTRESVVAEKLHVMVKRGILNSRMRDYFDIWTLSRQFDFDGGVLTAAVRETFGQRGLRIPSEPVALTEAFSRDATKQTQWRGFVRKSRLEDVGGDLQAVVEGIAQFLGPVVRALHDGNEFKGRWTSPGPWIYF